MPRAELGIDVFFEDARALAAASELLAAPFHVIIDNRLKGVGDQACLLAALGQWVTPGREGVVRGDGFRFGVVQRRARFALVLVPIAVLMFLALCLEAKDLAVQFQRRLIEPMRY
jgi:hypothetical protein